LIDIRQLSTVGGEISYTTFGPADSENVIFAPHGITANMMTWVGLAESLPDARIVAPDLRGRGRSNSLEGPFGLEQHALDAIELLDSLDIESYHIIGHSMGGFVSVRLAALDPSRVRSVLLVDGGLPLPRPNAVSDQDLVRATLGPAAERLEMVFGSESEYLDFWRAHPAFAETWSELLEQYLRHDLADVAGALKPSASISAVSAVNSSIPRKAISAVRNLWMGLPSGFISRNSSIICPFFERNLLMEMSPVRLTHKSRLTFRKFYNCLILKIF